MSSSAAFGCIFRNFKNQNVTATVAATENILSTNTTVLGIRMEKYKTVSNHTITIHHDFVPKVQRVIKLLKPSMQEASIINVHLPNILTPESKAQQVTNN